MTKTIYTSTTDIDADKGLIRGYIAIWHRPDDDGHFYVRGRSFKKTLMEHGPKPESSGSIPFLINGERSAGLGNFTRIWEDEIGLAYEARLFRRRPGVYRSDSKQIIDSVTNGYSFYHAIDIQIIAERSNEYGDKEITEARLFSASLLYFPIKLPQPVYDIHGRPITDLIVFMTELRRLLLSSRHMSVEQLDRLKQAHQRFGEFLAERRLTPRAVVR